MTMLSWLRCHLLGRHAYWSYAEEMQTMGPAAFFTAHPDLKPCANDSVDRVMAKFDECVLLRCRHCAYTYCAYTYGERSSHSL